MSFISCYPIVPNVATDQRSNRLQRGNNSIAVGLLLLSLELVLNDRYFTQIRPLTLAALDDALPGI